MRILLIALLALPYSFVAQPSDRATQQATYQLTIRRTVEKIRMDGDLSESTWQTAAIASNFWLKWPRDGAPAPEQTEVRCTYDDRFLYIAVTAYDSTPNYIVQSLKRDVGYWDSDGFAVVIDPTNTAASGYFFGVSATGVQTEGLLTGGNDDIDRNWDNVWYSKTRCYPNRWTAEMAIPLRILRFKEGQATWGINFIRNDLSNNLYSVWARIPFQFDGVDLGWTGSLIWDTAPKRVKGNYNISPYITSTISKNYKQSDNWRAKPGAGLDAKIGISSGLNLDVTANPDFSQIEIDEQVVNLTRFDIQLPEKRPFFLENGDIFGSFGIPSIRPFFSRAIGLDRNGAPLPILGGLRLTGNLNSHMRIGAMTMLTGRQGETPTASYSALAANYRVFGRSSVSGYLLDKESFGPNGERLASQYSRNAGFELGYTATDGKWSGWASHHRSFQAGINKQNWWGNAGFQYRVRGFSWLSDFLHMGKNYRADMGFERRIENYDVALDSSFRLGYNFWFNSISYQIFPKHKNGRVNFIEMGGELFNVINPNGTLNESSNSLYLSINFKNSSELRFRASPNWANVPVSFKFDDEEDLVLCPPLPAGRYAFSSVGGKWSSDYRQPLFYSISYDAGQFYNGMQWQTGAEITLRIQPVMNIAMQAQFNRLDFPQPYCDVQFWNITPRVEVFFARNIWWTTFLQYNTQSDNFNINSRLQWRYRPMSDLFVVYTDNYAVEQFGVKNRTLTAKLNWWF